jgi:hypothetical protein
MFDVVVLSASGSIIVAAMVFRVLRKGLLIRIKFEEEGGKHGLFDKLGERFKRGEPGGD